MRHLDLFSGIGGFALACDWAGVETICFCEIDEFCQKVLKKHWPDVPIVKDVNNVEEIVEKPNRARARCISQEIDNQEWRTCETRGTGLRCDNRAISTGGIDSTDKLLLTAGFPCQPFSAAGRRKGSADDRYLWPQTLAVIEAVKPNWVVLENVAGILSMVFPDSKFEMASQATFCEVPNDEIADYDTIAGRIDGDLKQAGYGTVWLVVPACAVNAPHRRDRVWIVAQSKSDRSGCQPDNFGYAWIQSNSERWAGMGEQLGDANPNATITQSRESRQSPESEGREDISRGDSEGGDVRNSKGNPGDSFRAIWERENTITRGSNRPIADSTEQGLQGAIAERSISGGCLAERNHIPGWTENWYEVATRFCRVDDGIPNRVDRLKALGNAIVPQVAYQIIKGILEVEREAEAKAAYQRRV